MLRTPAASTSIDTRIRPPYRRLDAAAIFTPGLRENVAANGFLSVPDVNADLEFDPPFG